MTLSYPEYYQLIHILFVSSRDTAQVAYNLSLIHVREALQPYDTEYTYDITASPMLYWHMMHVYSEMHTQSKVAIEDNLDDLINIIGAESPLAHTTTT